MACKYRYAGKEYSRAEIIQKIIEDKLYVKGDKIVAEKWLKEKLGDEQVIQWTSSLVNGNAFGQFTKDGSILLSELFEKGTEYHEAFHRVWQTFLTPKERKSILGELEGVDLSSVKKLYPRLGVEKLKEEYLAELFRDYVMNDGAIEFPTNTKTFFQKLLDFLKKLFGNKPLDMKELFRKINDSEYANAKVSYPVVLTPMNRIANFSIEESSEITRSVAQKFLSMLFNSSNAFRMFIDNRIPKQILIDRLGSPEGSAFENMLAETEDFDTYKKLDDNRIPILKEVLKYLRQFNINIEEDELEMATEAEGAKDSINSKPAFDTDDKTRFSSLIKLLLASVPSSKKGNTLGLTINADWSSLSSKLAKQLSGKAISTAVLFRELDNLSRIHPEFAPLLKILGGTNKEFFKKFTEHPDYATIMSGSKIYKDGKLVETHKVHPMMEQFNLRQEFHNAFTKHYYEFYNTYIEGDKIYAYNSDRDYREKGILRNIKNKLESDIQKIEYHQKQKYGKISQDTVFYAYQDWKRTGKEIFGDENHLLNFGIHDANENKGLLNSIASFLSNQNEKASSRDRLQPFEDADGLYKQMDSWLYRIAVLEAEYRSETELAVSNVEGNKVFPVNLHTFQTTILDSLHYYSSMSKESTLAELEDLLDEGLIDSATYDEMSKNYEEARKLITRERLPFMFNAYTQNSQWLKKFSERADLAPTLMIYDGLSTATNIDGKALADLDPTDLFSTFLGAMYNEEGDIIYPAFKHSDRSVMYGYRMYRGAKIADKATRKQDFIDSYKAYLEDQRAIQRLYKDKTSNSLYKNVSHFDPAGNKALLPDVSDEEIGKIFEEQLSKLEIALQYNGNLEIVDDKPIGISSVLWNKSGKNKEAALANIVTDSFIGFMEQTKLFTGDPSFYSSAANFFKRLNTQSSTGNPGTVDKLTNTVVDYMNKVTEVYYGISYPKVNNGEITEVVGVEVDNYASPVAQQIYDFYLEHGKKINHPEPEKYAQRYKDAYSGINENDGESYANLFSWREFMTRIEGWNPSLQMMFDIEMRHLNGTASSIFDDVLNEWMPRYVATFKPVHPKTKEFLTEEYFRKHPWEITDLYFEKFLEPFRPLKGQYMGPAYISDGVTSNTEGDEMSRIFVPAVRKTSYFPLIPSMIKGTNLEKLNNWMLKEGKDFLHMGSGAKVGTNLHIPLYDKNGKFVLDEVHEASKDSNGISPHDSKLDYRFMKNQVKISGHEKTKIIVATQARKNMLQNFTDEKLKTEYIELHRQIVYKALAEVDKVLDKPRKEFVEGIKRMLKDEPENVFNALELLLQDGFIEQLPNRNKVENILFAMVGKGGIRIKQGGNAAIQVAVTMFEGGDRKSIDPEAKKPILEASSELKTYLDKDGNIQEAEIMMALPQQWIKKVLRKYNTHDLQKALKELNDDLREGKFKNNVTFKGLRIPNQQVSSNDIFVVKKFFMPTISNMVVVPADIVVKTGSDFDVDKMNLYMPNLDENWEYINPEGKKPGEMSLKELENRLIQIDREILMHPDNFHQTMATIDDDLLKDDIYKELLKDLKASDYKGFAKVIENMEGLKSMKFFDILDIQQQVAQKVNAVDSKIGVGVVATEITGHTLFQLANVKVASEIKVGDKLVQTKVFSIGEDTYSLDSVYDNEGNLITENLSVILTSQVDAAKNPYAPRININKNTLPVLTYMVRRGVSLKETMYFLNQPIISEYLRRLNIHNSILYRTLDNKKSSTELRKSSAKIIEEVKKMIPNNEVEGSSYRENLLQNTNQHDMLQKFLDIKEQGDYMLAYKQGNSPDTDVPKNMMEYEQSLMAREKAQRSGLLVDEEGRDITPKLESEGIISPFFEAQERFKKLKQYYFTYRIPGFVRSLLDVSQHIFKPDRKLKLMDKINSELAQYLIQNNVGDENVKSAFERLFRSENNIGLRVMEAASKYNNQFLTTLSDKLKMSEQKKGKWEGVPSLKFNAPKDPFALNNFIEHFRELESIDKELYQDLVLASILQSAINPSPFSWLQVFPNQGYDADLFQRAFKINPEEIDFDKFLKAFFFNNVEYMPDYSEYKRLEDNSWFKQRQLLKSWDREKKMNMIQVGTDENRALNDYREPYGTYHVRNYKVNSSIIKGENVIKSTANTENSRSEGKKTIGKKQYGVSNITLNGRTISIAKLEEIVEVFSDIDYSTTEDQRFKSGPLKSYGMSNAQFEYTKQNQELIEFILSNTEDELIEDFIKSILPSPIVEKDSSGQLSLFDDSICTIV